MDHTAYISMKNIVKTFGKVVANNNVNFSVEKARFMRCWVRMEPGKVP